MRFHTLNSTIWGNVIAHINEQRANGKVCTVTVTPYRKPRTTPQNALYWVWLTEIRDHIHASTGEAFTPEELHADFGVKFLPGTMRRNVFGEQRFNPVSTTTLSVAEFGEYLTKIEAYCVVSLGMELSKMDWFDEQRRAG